MPSDMYGIVYIPFKESVKECRSKIVKELEEAGVLSTVAGPHGIAGEYTKFEKVEILSAYAPKEATCWNITMILKNTGSASATLINAYVNNKPIGEYSPTINCPQMKSGIGLTIGSGEQVTLYMQVPPSLFSSGTTLNVKLHSAGGMDYIKLVELT